MDRGAGHGASDPGVPEAIPTTVRGLRERLGTGALERLWIFPPLVRGRRERGLVVAACYGESPGRRRLVTAAYVAERTGRGLSFHPDVAEEGSAPSAHVERVIAGVVRRSGLDLGEPREVQIAGDPESLERLLAELDAATPSGP